MSTQFNNSSTSVNSSKLLKRKKKLSETWMYSMRMANCSCYLHYDCLLKCFVWMVFKATFSNVSATSWHQFYWGGGCSAWWETSIPTLPLSKWITTLDLTYITVHSCIIVSSKIVIHGWMEMFVLAHMHGFEF